MNFDFDNERPIYVQLKEKLIFMIISSYYELGQRLPSVRELSLKAKVNPNTLQKALSDLEDEKLIYTERTNGKFVTNDKRIIQKVKKDLAEDIIKKYVGDMNKLGITYEESIKFLEEWRRK